jgi:hypothetical protein
MPQAASGTQQARKKSVLVAGLGAAFISAAITVVVLSSNPTPSATPAAAPVQTAAAPAQTAAPDVKACKIEPLIELASTENGGGGTIRFREGNFVSQPITLTGTPQPIVFPRGRPETAPLEESIIIEGNATNVVLGAEGDHFVVPRVDGSYSYTITWSPKKC